MTLTLAILFGLFLAYANGADDNFKEAATLYGSGTRQRANSCWARSSSSPVSS
jgi:phosphate/sulfate permease